MVPNGIDKRLHFKPCALATNGRRKQRCARADPVGAAPLVVGRGGSVFLAGKFLAGRRQFRRPTSGKGRACGGDCGGRQAQKRSALPVFYQPLRQFSYLRNELV